MTQFVNQYREQFGVEPICEVLEFPTSTYYAARKRAEQPSARAADDEKMVVEIRRVWKASGKRYGARKVYAQLRREGIAVARCTVERLMRRLGMSGLVVRRRRPRTTIPSQAGGRPRDLVDRDFRAPAPNQLWVTDLTYVEMALWARQDTLSAALVHHGDRGVQYTAIRYAQRLTEAGIAQSVGRKGDSYDNALAESVNALYKKEAIDQHHPLGDIRDVIRVTAEWIYWYNHERLHSWCDYRPPLEYEQVFWQDRPAQPPTAA